MGCKFPLGSFRNLGLTKLTSLNISCLTLLSTVGTKHLIKP